MPKYNGFAPILILLAAAGIIFFLFISSTFPFKDRLFNALFPKPPSHAQEANSVPDEILLQFKPGVDEKGKDNVKQMHGLDVIKSIPEMDIVVVKVPEKAKNRFIEALRKNPLVDGAESNIRFQGVTITNDSYLPNQWGMFNIKAADNSTTSAWGVTTGSPAVKIAILDTGINNSHPDLTGKVVASTNFTTSSTSSDISGHGSIVAGIAAANTNNSAGVAGVGYNSTLMNVKVLGDDGFGYWDWVASGITWAVQNGAKVINMSLGSAWECDSFTENMVNYAWNNGVVLVAAAGNNGSNASFIPASCPNAIAVAATDQNNNKTSFSNYGPWVDVAAPGTGIYSTAKNGGYESWWGTSMSAPHVAGLAALIWAKGDCSTNYCVRNQIESTADQVNGTGSYWTYGRVNAYKAVTQPPLPPPDTTPPTTSITSPTNGQTLSGTIDIQASAADNAGVTKVEFYKDGGLHATDLSSPYVASWDTKNVSNGSHSLFTKAYDSAGNAGTSGAISVNVSNPVPDTTPPTTSITSPTNGQTLSGTIDIQASAADNVAVSSVSFFVDGIFEGIDYAAPYTVSWDTTTETNAPYTLQSKTLDSSGNIGSSAIINVTVNNISSTPTPTVIPTPTPTPTLTPTTIPTPTSTPKPTSTPTPTTIPTPTPIPTPAPDTSSPNVSLTNPINGSKVSGNATIQASASDNVGVAKVEIYVNGVLKSIDTASPYSYDWNSQTVANGSHSISAKAFDAANNSSTDAIAVAVQNGDTQAPSTPTNLSANAPAYNKVDLSWNASTDNVGVAGYWIIRNGVTIAQTSTNSYTDSSVSASSTYNYQVKSYDAANNISGSSNTATITTPSAPDIQPPTAPANLVANAVSSSQVNLSWNASTDNVGVKSYEVYRNSTRIADITTTSFGDSGLSASTTYSYFVKAKDAAGNISPNSNTSSATTLAPPTAGSIVGSVSSSTGGVISGAKISLTVGKSKKTYTTNSLGQYEIIIPNGTYNLKFAARGYNTQTVSVTVSGNTVTRNVILIKR